MSDMTFKPGDLVQLRSGGPSMTLASGDGTTCVCMWFDAQQRLDSQPFPAHVLQAYRPPDDSTWTLASLERRGADKI